MKKRSLRIFLMIVFLATLGVSSAYAQSGNTQTADVPFEFAVGDRTFPAGTYSITRLNPQSDNVALVIKSADGKMSKIVLTTPVLAKGTLENAKLVFKRYDEGYFLSEVWTAADDTGQLLKSGNKQLLARRSGVKPFERVEIALKARRR
jgi:hypothetical protein